jgi:nitroreductase
MYCSFAKIETGDLYMNLKQALEERRAFKHFDKEHSLAEEEIQELFSAVQLAPTAFNIQHCRFVLVTDPELRQKLRAVAWNQAQVTDSSLLVILCGDIKAWEKDPIRYWRNSSPEYQEIVLPSIDAYYRGRDQVQRDEVMRSCGMAAQTLMLTAKSMDLGSCPMVGFDFDAVGKLINLPDDHVVAMMVAVGKTTAPANPRGGFLPLDEVLIRNHF